MSFIMTFIMHDDKAFQLVRSSSGTFPGLFSLENNLVKTTKLINIYKFSLQLYIYVYIPLDSPRDLVRGCCKGVRNKVI